MNLDVIHDLTRLPLKRKFLTGRRESVQEHHTDCTQTFESLVSVTDRSIPRANVIRP